MKASIYQQLVAANVPIDSHESDLYAKVTPESREIVMLYKFWRDVKLFQATDGSGAWFDIPFEFAPWWNERALAITRKTQ